MEMKLSYQVKHLKNDMVNASKVLYDSFIKKYDWAKDVVQKINEAK